MEDFNNADPQRQFDVIPADTIVTLQIKVRPGNAGEGGLLTPSKDGSSEGLDLEYTVVDGKYAKRKLFERLTLQGLTQGHAEAARISQSKIRAILECVRGIRPDDKSESATQARRITGYGELDGMRFIGRVGVEPPRNGYPTKNRIVEVLTPERKDWHHVEQVAKPTATPATTARPASTPTAIDRPAWART
jgi:hypothetical protein